MTIDDAAWDTVAKELVLMARISDDANTAQAFLDAATKQHTLFHVARTYRVLGSLTSPNQPSHYSYDLLGNLTQVLQVGDNTDECGGTTSSCSQTRTFLYDALSRLKQATNPETGAIDYTYYPNGNLHTKFDARGITTTYTYDRLNRVKTRVYTDEPEGSETPDVGYFYDNVANARGKLVKVESSVSTTEYTAFDILGRVTASKQTTDGVTYGNGSTDSLMTYTYNLSGALVEQQYPSGRKVKNIVDDSGDLALVQSKNNATYAYWNYANHFTYNAAGAVTSMQLGNGTWESTQFNSRFQPTQIALGKTQGATNLLDLDYTYGTANQNNGNVMSQTITVPTVGSNTGFTAVQSYNYDSLNRLKDATENVTPHGGSQTQSWKQTFLFDRYGNRNFDEANTSFAGFDKLCNGNTELCTDLRKKLNPSINTSDNRISSGQDYGFDSSGNTTADPDGRAFIYDAENKQVKVLDDQEATIGEYFYDGDGKRVKKHVPPQGQNPGETTVFVYDAAGKLISEYSTIVETTNAKVAYLTNDHLGSPRINTDANGAVTARDDYRPFGEEITTSQRTAGLGYVEDTVRKQFTGYERDNEIGLDYAQARYYNNQHGRFTSTDPTLLSVNGFNPQSWNRYVYVMNNPLLYTDPLGLWAVSFDPVYKKDKDGNATTEIDYYIAVAVKTKDTDDGARLAEQLGLRGKEAERFAKSFDEKLADGKIDGDKVRLSKLGGDVGRVFGVVEGLYTDQKKYEAKHGNNGKGPGNARYADCSSTACNLADPGAGASGQNWSVFRMDEYIRSNGLRPQSEEDLRIADIIRYATGEGSKNVPAHFTTFIFRNDNGDPIVFSRSGEGGPFQVNTAKSFENATYGRIRGRGKDPTGYYRPR